MIKVADLVYHERTRLTGQVVKIRHDLVTIVFVTGDKVEKKIKDIFYVENQWRMND